MIIFISVLLVCLIVLGFETIKKSALKKESKLDINDFVVYLPLTWIWLFLIVSAITAVILLLLNIFDGSNLAANILIPIVILFFMAGAFVGIKKKLHIVGDDITVTPVLGRKKHYNFSDITKAKYSAGNYIFGIKIYNDKKKIFSIDKYAIGYNLFIQRLSDIKIFVTF